jgi:hypothetical protein
MLWVSDFTLQKTAVRKNILQEAYLFVFLFVQNKKNTTFVKKFRHDKIFTH